jgi:hypothetical protein
VHGQILMIAAHISARAALFTMRGIKAARRCDCEPLFSTHIHTNNKCVTRRRRERAETAAHPPLLCRKLAYLMCEALHARAESVRLVLYLFSAAAMRNVSQQVARPPAASSASLFDVCDPAREESFSIR